ncbi:MAG: hypothetical protein ACK50J_13150 [Planctomyces sp.]
MSEELYRVFFPNGESTKPYSREQIRRAFSAGRIQKDASVLCDGVMIGIVKFLEGIPEPIATERQKAFARSLGIEVSPNISRSEITVLIGQAMAKKNQEGWEASQPAEVQDEDLRERLRNEILEEMREAGDIPLSRATPEEIARYFNDVRLQNMLIVYSDSNSFEQFIAAADSNDVSLCKGGSLAFAKPDGMPREDLRNLLIACMWGLDL